MNLEKAHVAAAFASTGLISLAPNLLLFLFPSVAHANSNVYLSLGQALAAGGLLGDVFLHTLPHAYADVQDGEGGGEGADVIGQMILLGFLAFYVLDTMIRMASPGGSGCGHSHSHSHNHNHNHGPSHGQSKGKDEQQATGGTGTVILNLMADSLHNFTDGLAIGATYAAGASVSSHHDHDHVHDDHLHRRHDDSGLSMAAVVAAMSTSRGGLASVSVLFHEIPHELGDYAILVKHGYSKNQAIGLQFVTAIAALCGTGVGLLAGHFHGADRYMVPFTSGGFVYLAAVTILPELLAETPNAPKQGSPSVARMAQVACFCMGIAFMQGVAMLEHMEGGTCSHGHGHGHAHHDDFDSHHHGHGHHHHHTNHSEL